MSYLIAITGKGGVGKTTIAGSMVLKLIARRYVPVLAIDADPNNCLDNILGVSVKKTVGGIREDVRMTTGNSMASGVSQHDRLQLMISESLVESKDFDLIAMGRPEGPGCYCYANNVLKSIITEVSLHYPFIVVDNEAGLENLSRRIIKKANLLILVSDPSNQGIETLQRLYNLSLEMGLAYDQLVIIINQLRNRELPATINKIKQKTQAYFIINIPYDHNLSNFSEQGLSLQHLKQDNKVLKSLDTLIDGLPLKA